MGQPSRRAHREERVKHIVATALCRCALERNASTERGGYKKCCESAGMPQYFRSRQTRDSFAKLRLYEINDTNNPHCDGTALY